MGKHTCRCGSAHAVLRRSAFTRVTANIGYSIESNEGDMLMLNPLQPCGSLNFNYHQPTAQLEVRMVQHIDWVLGWNYYDYDEQSPAGPTLP